MTLVWREISFWFRVNIILTKPVQSQQYCKKHDFCLEQDYLTLTEHFNWLNSPIFLSQPCFYTLLCAESYKKNKATQSNDCWWLCNHHNPLCYNTIFLSINVWREMRFAGVFWIAKNQIFRSESKKYIFMYWNQYYTHSHNLFIFILVKREEFDQ